MSLIKRKGSPYYWTRFTAPNGTRVQRSTKTVNRSEAQEYEDRLKAELWRKIQVGDKPKMTWEQAVVRYLRETNNKARKDDISTFKALHSHLSGLYLNQIDDVIIQKFIAYRIKKGNANKTINNKLKKLKAVLNMAKSDWKVDIDPPRIKELPTPKGRVRWITQAEARRLIDELPEHLKAVVIFSLETGLRLSNVTHLKWEQIDFQRNAIYFEGENILKTNKAFTVPLTDNARDIIKRQINKHHTWVFTYKGKQNKSPNGESWKKALDRAGIKDFRWHDLRHTWATWHIQQGTPLHILQELGGWTNLDMVKRYAHFSVEHLAEYVNGTKLVHSKIEDEKKPVLKML